MLIDDNLPNPWPSEVVTVTAEPTLPEPSKTSIEDTLTIELVLPEEHKKLLIDSLLILFFGSLVITVPICFLSAYETADS